MMCSTPLQWLTFVCLLGIAIVITVCSDQIILNLISWWLRRSERRKRS
jgi:hypothetical protein